MASIQCAGNCVTDDAGNELDEHRYATTTADFFGFIEYDYENLSGNRFDLPLHFRLIYIFVFVVMVTVTAGGNGIAVWVVLAHKRMRTVLNYFLVNLAIAGVLISVASAPFNFVYMLHEHWPFGKAYCKFLQFITPCTISASVFTFMAIAINRFMAVIYPSKPPRMEADLGLTVIVVIWFVSGVIASPNVLFTDLHSLTNRNGEVKTVCYQSWPNSTFELTYNVFLLLVNYIAPLAALLIAYTAIGKKLWGSQAIGERTAGQEETIRSKRRVVRTMIIIVVIFAVCWLPQHTFYVVSSLYSTMDLHEYTQHVHFIIHLVATSYCMYNPILYCWMDARFRSGFKYVFRWLPCITWHPSDALGIGGGCAEIVPLGVTVDASHTVNGNPEILDTATTTTHSDGPVNVVHYGGAQQCTVPMVTTEGGRR